MLTFNLQNPTSAQELASLLQAFRALGVEYTIDNGQFDHIINITVKGA